MAESSQIKIKEEPASTSRKRVECNPCSTTESVEEATFYCIQCKEYFCESCTVYHRRFTMSKNHRVIHKNDVQFEEDLGTTEKHKSSWKNCELHEGNCVEMFCSTHSVLCCSLCINENHNTCVVDRIEAAAQGFLDSGIYRNIAEKSSAIKNRIINLQQEYTKAETNLAEYTRQGKIKSQNVATAIFQRVLETKGSILQNEILQYINRSKIELKAMIQDIQHFQVSLDSKSYFEEELFVISHRQNTKMTTFSNYIDTCIKKLPNPWMVHVNYENEQILSDFIELKRTTKTSVVVKKKDEVDCRISYIESLSDGRFILADKANKNLKVFKRNSGFDFAEDIGDEPLVVTEVEPGKIAVLMSDQKVIQFYRVTDKFEKLNKVDLKDSPTGMSAFQQTLYVSFRGYVSVIGNHEGLHERISKNEKGEELFTNISCVRVNKNLRRLYLIDDGKLVSVPLKAIRQHTKVSNFIFGSSSFKHSMTVVDDNSLLVCFQNEIRHVTPDLKEIQGYSYEEFVSPIFERQVYVNRSYTNKNSPESMCCISYNTCLGRLYIGGESNRLCVIQIG